MDHLIYTVSGAAAETLVAQQIHVNNLANVNTHGFKADFSQLQSRYVMGAGFPTNAFTVVQEPGSDLSSGILINTDRELDVAIKGNGWLTVQLPDGSEAYTRSGNLQLTANGQLVTTQGYPVMGNGGPISIPPSEKIEIGEDGTITVRPQGQGPEALTQLDRLKLVNPAPQLMQKTTTGLFRTNDGSVPAPDAQVQVVAGTLEGSNVNAVGTLTDIISLSRQFEIELKMMKTAEQNSAVTDQLLRTTG